MQSLDYDVPFISNTPEDTQCLQAAYGMIRQYFDPGIMIGWDEWSDITGYLPGNGTMSMAGLMWFKENGYDVVHIASFDYAEFALRGDEYLLEALGEEIGNFRLGMIDLKLEQARALRFLGKGIWKKHEATLADVRYYLDEGYLVKCLVNLNALNGLPGYVGHAVVVKGYTDSEIILHDPGLPARPNRHVPDSLFADAWKSEGPHSEKMDAIRKESVRPMIHRNFHEPVRSSTMPSEPVAA